MPDRADSPSFALTTPGFERAPVDQRLAALTDALAQVQALLEEREHRSGRLADELAQARRRLLEVAPPTYSGSGARIDHVVRMAQEQARDVLDIATREAEGTRTRAHAEAEQTLALARTEAAEQVEAARRVSLDLRAAALTHAAQVVDAATRTAEGVSAAAQRGAAERRSVAEELIRAQRDLVEAELDRQRADVDRETAALHESAEREAAELRAAAREDADALLGEAIRDQAELRREVEQLTDGLDTRLVARRTEAQWLDAARHQRAFAVITAVLADADERARAAEQRAATATAQAEQLLNEGREYTKGVVDQARAEAEQITGQAQARAQELIADATAEAARLGEAAQRDVADLTGRRDDVADHVREVRVLLDRTPAVGLVVLATESEDT